MPQSQVRLHTHILRDNGKHNTALSVCADGWEGVFTSLVCLRHVSRTWNFWKLGLLFFPEVPMT